MFQWMIQWMIQWTSIFQYVPMDMIKGKIKSSLLSAKRYYIYNHKWVKIEKSSILSYDKETYNSRVWN